MLFPKEAFLYLDLMKLLRDVIFGIRNIYLNYFSIKILYPLEDKVKRVSGDSDSLLFIQ